MAMVFVRANEGRYSDDPWRRGARNIEVRGKALSSRHGDGTSRGTANCGLGAASGMALGLTIDRGNYGELLGIKRPLANVDLVWLGRLVESDAAMEPASEGRKVGCYRKVVSSKGLFRELSQNRVRDSGQYNSRTVVANSDESPRMSVDKIEDQ